LLRKFTELAFDESGEMRWQESRPTEADNMAGFNAPRGFPHRGKRSIGSPAGPRSR
jgi:hypothetical protein